MATATDLITYIGVPLTVLGVLPILYNAVQCLLIRHRLRRSLPAAARPFLSLHPDPVAGTVVCSFRKPTFDFHDVLVRLKRGHTLVNIQSLPYVECQGLGASWMRLIRAIGLESQGEKQFQRIVVNSSLDVNPLAMNCDWKSFVFLALGLGVSPLDPVFYGLGGGKDGASAQSLRSTALHSEMGQQLVEIQWREGVPYLELTEHCSSWSVRRSLAHSLHMVVARESKQEVLHFVPATGGNSQTPTAQICDCKETDLRSVEFSTLRQIRYAITWTLYFEELWHQIPKETILIPQSLLLLQFEITEELHKTPTERLQYRISNIFPANAALVANIMSALTSIWNSSEHRKLLNSLGGAVHESKLESPRGPVSNITVPSTQYHSFDLYPALLSSPTFQSLSLAYSPSAIISAKTKSPSSNAPASAVIDMDDHSKPETLLARLIIALSAMRRSTTPRGWVTSIASGALKFKVGFDSGEDMAREVLEYQGGTLRVG